MGRVLRTSQAAKRAGVIPVTIRRWIASGKLKAFRTLGGQIRIHEGDLEEAIRSATYDANQRQLFGDPFPEGF